MATTTNYTWAKPTPGASYGTWGATLNTAIDDIDADLKTVDDAQVASAAVASAALPKAGGTCTGLVDFLSTRVKAVNLGATLTGTVTINLAQGNFFYGTVTDTITLAISNTPTAGSDYVISFLLVLTNGGDETVNWPSNILTPGGVLPELTGSTGVIGGVDFISFTSYDEGATWFVTVKRDFRWGPAGGGWS